MTVHLLGAGRPESDLVERVSELLAADDQAVDARAGQLSYWALGPTAVRGADYIGVGNAVASRFLNDSLFYLTSQPSIIALNGEVTAAVSRLVDGGPRAVTTITVGGTESNALAMFAARTWARERRPEVTAPEVVLSRTAHPSFHKAASWLGLRPVVTPFDVDYRADVDAMRGAVTSNTIMVVGSAPSYTHGSYDPIESLADLASDLGLWLHVDSCVGGIISPYLRAVGAEIPRYDLAVAGVSSISADLHKHAYAPVGISSLTFADEELQSCSVFSFDDWPNGLHRGPTFISSRSAAPLAGAWAILNTLGDDGFLELARLIDRSRRRLLEGIRSIPGLAVCGRPQATIMTVASGRFDMFAVAEGMEDRGWNIFRTREPEGIHLIVDPFDDEPLVEEFLADLSAAASEVSAGLRGRDSDRGASY